MNCPKCGQPVEPGATFCGNCGQPLQAGTAPGVTAPQTQTQVQPVQVPGAAPAKTPIAQVMANQAGSRPAPANTFTTPAAGAVVSGSGVPTFAGAAAPVAPAAEHAGETRAIIGLIFGVIGIPAALLPIAGLILGIIGVVLGTTARSHYKHLLSLLAIIFSSLAIIAALGSWVYIMEHDSRLHHSSAAAGSSKSTASKNLKAISTPCYTVKIPTGLDNYTPSGCNFDSANTEDEYTVAAHVEPTVTAATLQQNGQQMVQAAAKGLSGTITSQNSGKFAGSPAYIANITSSDGHRGMFAIVLHPSANQQNLFLVAHFERSGSPTLDSLEKNWQWH